jgi:hypothetical protein
MVQAKLLRNVTVPTNRQMRIQHIPQVAHVNFIPGNQFSVRALKPGLVINPVKFWKWNLAIDALFAAIPSH